VIHAAAAPSHLSPERLHLTPGVGGDVSVEPHDAGWRYLGFRAATLSGGETLSVERPGHEHAVVVLSGGLRVEPEGLPPVELPGRQSVFDGAPWAIYLPVDAGARATPLDETATVAVASAPASGKAEPSTGPIVIGPDEVAIEVRGAGNATRQINHIIPPDFPADRLLVVEVYTPSGNWSSWPPHKHDVDDMPHEAVLEEIYHYQFRRPEAWGIQRLYRRDRTRDALWTVHHGDLVLVTDGYHPFVASHGDDAYYLNALAGDRRTMACSFDPDLDWVRSAWTDMEPDPRVPVVPHAAAV
jgi:5-deoxy-glucuronate isomerase